MQDINTVPEDLKAIYRTAWEIDSEAIIDMAADRAPYIDQSQSLSLYMTKPDGMVLVRTPVTDTLRVMLTDRLAPLHYRPISSYARGS